MRFLIFTCLLCASGVICRPAIATDDPAAEPQLQLTEAESGPDPETEVNSDKEAPADTNFSLESKPRWEVGLGGAYVDGFDYPASDNPNRRGIVLPYAIYRGSRIRFAGRGFSAVALERSNLKLDLSLAASLDAESEGNALRESMPDLDFLFELGPQLILRLVDQPAGDNGRVIVSWSNRARAVFSTDFNSVDSQGWVVQTQLQTVYRKLFFENLDVLGFVNMSWATEKLHDYYYQVDPEFVTPVRQEFDAKGGYLGANLFLGMAYRARPTLRLFGGVRIGYFKGAANEDSPLFETTSNAGVAFGFAWSAYQSKERIFVLEEE